MQSAEFKNFSSHIYNSDKPVICCGSIQKFDGFLKLYQETKKEEDEKDDNDDDENILPNVNEGDELKLDKIIDEQHFYKSSSKTWSSFS